MEDNRDYRRLVNPTFETAKITSFLLAQTEDESAIKFSEILDIPDPFQANESFLNDMFKTIAAINNEARYRAVSLNLSNSGLDNYLDLACGYTHRGMDMLETGINYVGFDVPAVVEELNEGFSQSGIENIPLYMEGDVTNPVSLKQAADRLEGELLISTEGLLTYLNESELSEMSNTLRAILQEHGGFWLLTDTTNFLTKAFEVLATEDPSLLKQLNECFKYLRRDREINAESTDTTEEAWISEFLQKNGFNIEEVPYYSDEFEVKLLDRLPENLKDKLTGLLESLTVWKLTPAETYHSESKSQIQDREFSLETSLDSGTLNITMTGRLDTLSAPELLKIFNENDTESLKQLILDFNDVSFVSSAGVRVLNRIAEELKDRPMKIINASASVL